MGLQQQSIDIEDAIDIRQVKNLKLANQLLKLKRKQKQAKDQEMQQANIQAQAAANAQATEQAAMYEVQKQEALAQKELQIKQGEAQLEIQKLETEAAIKKELMEIEFQYQLRLAGMQRQNEESKERYIEDRKDKRTKIQATQQSEMISQRQNDLLPKNFESENDGLSGLNLEQFVPR